MSHSSLESLKIKAKLLQKAKIKASNDFALKDAYAILAKTAGYRSWKEMKDDYEVSDVFNPPRWSAQWKNWFNTREEALEHFNSRENYLIPFRKQFFICDENYIKALGIEMDDDDLNAVGNDWTNPQDVKSWGRLVHKITLKHSK